MRRAIALPLLASVLLAGCSMAPKHVRPASPVDPVYRADIAPEGGSRQATDIGWREFFADERLLWLIGKALENNRDLRVAVARIEEARGQYRIIDAERLPQLGASASAIRSRTPLGSLAQQGVGAGAGDGAGIPGAIVANRYDVGVGVSAFELDFWGRVRSLSEAARASYLQTMEAERAFRLSLIRDVANAYVTSRGLAEQAEIAERTVESRREGLRIAKLRLDAGVTSALDYRQAETLLTQAETQLAVLRRSRAETRNLIRLLIGIPVDEAEVPPARVLAAQGLVRDIAAGLPSDLLNNRPDILAAEEGLRAARANIGAARAAFFPTISLTGRAGFASNQLDDLVGESGLAWSFGPSISLPIFDWGARRGNLTVAEAREDIAVATYERTVQTAFREVSDALAGRRFLAEQIAAQERAVVAQRASAALARARYTNGVAQYIEVLDAERNLFSAEQTLVELRAGEIQNLVSLYVALGGGLGPAPN